MHVCAESSKDIIVARMRGTVSGEGEDQVEKGLEYFSRKS
jgi:hypothetical protein